MATSRKSSTRTRVGQVERIGPRRCTVSYENSHYNCSLKKYIADQQQTLLAVGDHVAFLDTGGNTGRVEKVLPRRTSLTRTDPGKSKRPRVIAANIDYVVIMVSAKEPPLRPRLIDRYVAAVCAGGASPVICVNKLDLATSVDERSAITDMLSPYRDMHVPVVLVSAQTGEGMEELTGVLSGATSAFVGHSGVGKSSLLNLLGRHNLARTGDVSSGNRKGTHTTSGSQMYYLPGDLHIIDTPGVREFGLDDKSQQSIETAFPEIRGLAGSCRHSDCTHSHEPGCAVKEAVERGEISPLRYTSYRRLKGGDSSDEDDADQFACAHCRRTVSAAAPGTENRNHCPYCLWSVHVDNRPGDRKAFCKGTMEPITVWVRDGEWVIIHRCTTCGSLHANRIAGDDNEALLLSLAVRPLASPPFSLEGVSRG